MIARIKYNLLFLFCICLFVSCATYNHKNPYPGIEIVRYGNSQAYVFRNVLSDKLIINIDGSGWDSVLGTKNEKRWTLTHNGAQFLQVLGDKYTFFIPEKFKRQPGMIYDKDMEDRANYTANNLLDCYIESINGYLAEHSFSSIILIGSSEGAALLPMVYERMNNKDMVKALVSISFGGYSLYESYQILSESPEVPQETKNMYKHILEVYEYIEELKTKNNEMTISTEELFYGLNYRWFDSFMGLRPFDYYKNINIPVLFVHGDNDINIPVESTIFIQENLQEKPFTYKYFRWAHQPQKRSHVFAERDEIAEWIENIDL
jgi:pimeloyl-ACP methyl ester carboxylesterase